MSQFLIFVSAYAADPQLVWTQLVWITACLNLAPRRRRLPKRKLLQILNIKLGLTGRHTKGATINLATSVSKKHITRYSLEKILTRQGRLRS